MPWTQRFLSSWIQSISGYLWQSSEKNTSEAIKPWAFSPLSITSSHMQAAGYKAQLGKASASWPTGLLAFSAPAKHTFRWGPTWSSDQLAEASPKFQDLCTSMQAIPAVLDSGPAFPHIKAEMTKQILGQPDKHHFVAVASVMYIFYHILNTPFLMVWSLTKNSTQIYQNNV